jgi:hypothetical protein
MSATDDSGVAPSQSIGSSIKGQSAGAGDFSPQVSSNSTIALTATTVGHQLKYHKEISAFSDCPPKLIESQSQGFRVCFADINDSRNFLPNAILDLARTDGKAPLPCCSSYAISLYSSLESLSSRVTRILKTNKKFLQKKGNSYALLSLDSNCGRTTSPDANGHFDLFEYSTFSPLSKVIEIGGLAL